MAFTIKYIFVYGTLRKSAETQMSRILDNHCEYIGEATLQGVLYEIDTYPGAIESPNSSDKIQGELHKIITQENTLLDILDDYEECTEYFTQPHEYIRKALPITLLKTGERIISWVYIYNLDVTSLHRIN